VLVHPTAPQGIREMSMDEFGLVPPIGFMLDTTLAFSRIILSGFIDRYPRIKLIAAHGGATLPYLAGRLDRCHEKIPACASVIQDKPSTYLERIYYDTVVYDARALELCIAVAGSPDNVLYGSGYPHNIGDMTGWLAGVNALPSDPGRRCDRHSRGRALSHGSAHLQISLIDQLAYLQSSRRIDRGRQRQRAHLWFRGRGDRRRRPGVLSRRCRRRRRNCGRRNG
jgi:hypothetical protein